MANSTAEIVRKKIEKIEEGALFAYSSFNFDKSGELSVAKALSRMAGRRNYRAFCQRQVLQAKRYNLRKIAAK